MTGALSRAASYLLSGYRHLIAGKLIAGINISGLATGLAAVILIVLYVTDELSFDRWLPDAGRVYRLETTFFPPGRGVLEFATAIAPIKPLLDAEFAELIEATSRIRRSPITVTLGDRHFNETVNYVDPEFFKVLDLPMAMGEGNRALADSSALLISESTARKYFGEHNPLGRTVTFNSDLDYTVAGVFKDIPTNSHMSFDVIATVDRNRMPNAQILDVWAGVSVHYYIKLKDGIAADDLESDLPDFFRRNAASQVPGLNNISLADITKLRLTAVPDIHLQPSRRGDMRPGGSLAAVQSFAVVAALILVIACINFVNLATARSSRRAREISMRKVLGAHRRQLIGQFLGESALMATIALFMAITIVWATLPYYNGFLSKTLTFDPARDPMLLVALTGLTLFISLAAGLYPAFHLSSFKPARVLSSNQSSWDGGRDFRNALVLIQFTISIGLILSTMVVYSQMKYARTMDLGFNRDHMMVLGGLGRAQASAASEAIKNEITKLPGVIAATRSNVVPPIIGSPNTIVELPDQETEGTIAIEQIEVDTDYFETYGMRALAGRLFSDEFQADILVMPEDESFEPTQSTILNEAAVKQLGFGTPEAALGKTMLSLAGGGNRQARTTVIGIVKDAHFHSIHTGIAPTLFVLRDTGFGNLTANVRSEDLPATIAAIEEIWRSFAPSEPIAQSFINQNFAALYAGGEQHGEMFLYFSIFAIFVASLGLYGLSSFAAERRTKEIGMRKVMGAGVLDIVRLLIWQFSRPVLLANILAWPMAWYFMSDWLDGFVYRIDLNVFYFLAAGAAALAIAWATVAGHAVHVARTNPIHALRYE